MPFKGADVLNFETPLPISKNQHKWLCGRLYPIRKISLESVRRQEAWLRMRDFVDICACVRTQVASAGDDDSNRWLSVRVRARDHLGGGSDPAGPVRVSAGGWDWRDHARDGDAVCRGGRWDDAADHQGDADVRHSRRRRSQDRTRGRLRVKPDCQALFKAKWN